MKGLTTMKLALAQISMTENMQENLEKSLLFCDFAKGNDLLFFPEIQLSPFFRSMRKEMLIVTVLLLMRKKFPD